LTFAGGLIVREVARTGLCQICMYLSKGIVIGTINGLQLNKGRSDGIINWNEWQLIIIFGKDR